MIKTTNVKNSNHLDNNKKSLKIRSILINKLKKFNQDKAKICVVIGGHGFMLQTLKKNKIQTILWYQFWKLWFFNE